MWTQRFAFMTVGRWQDQDGCSSHLRHGGAGGTQGPLRVAFANDTDADRHGIVARSTGLMNQDHYLAVAIHLRTLTHRPGAGRRGRLWARTLVSSADRPRGGGRNGFRRCRPVSNGSSTASLTGHAASGARESAGASFLKQDGTVWTTDKDGITCGSPCRGR